MLVIRCLIAAAFIIFANALQRWEFTGKSLYDTSPAYFNGSLASWWNIHDANFTKLVYGGVTAVYQNSTADSLPQEIEILINDMTEVPDTTSYAASIVHIYRLHHCADYEHPLEMEIGLYDYARRTFLKHDTYIPLLGKLYVVTLHTTALSTTTEHKIIVTSDLRGTLSVMQHVTSNLTDTTCNTDTSSTPSVASTVPIKIRALNYNIWHNSPPSWFIPEQAKRWQRYVARLRHLATVITHQQADIIALQEVRLDNTFYTSPGSEVTQDLDTIQSLSLYQRPDKSGSQLMHLAAALQQVKHENHAFENYNLIFQPAMLLSDKRRPAQRNEEGVALLIHKRYTVNDVAYLLLPRNLTDKTDDHQRIALHASLTIQQDGGVVGVDVVTTHLSLSDSMRRISFEAVNSHLKNSKNAVQLFLGDFNAEPFEASYEYITNTTSEYPFRDAWNVSEEASPSDGFTYPACKPAKRIDYILYRSTNNISVHHTRLVGTTPWNTTEEELCLGYRDGLGMLDEDSPLWASDHFGLVMELEIVV